MSTYLPRKIRYIALFTSVMISACTTTQQPVAPPPPKPVVTTPTPPPPLSITQRPISERVQEPLVKGAANHAVLMQQILSIPDQTVSEPTDLNAIMDGLAQVFSPSLGPALIGYGSLVAVQNTEFSEGVLERARYQGIDSVIYQLYSDPNYAASLPGASSAGKDIQSAWASDVAAIGRTGAHIKSLSYDLQKQKSWKKMRADSRPERLRSLENAKSLRYEAPYQTRSEIAKIGTLRASDNDTAQKRQKFWQTYGRNAPPISQTFATQYQSVMHRKALTLSALEILGASGNDSKTWIDNYMTSPRLNRCITTARLNTAQCIAAGHYKYEDAFCIAEHELKEISNCLTKSIL
ncbi:MAG TPA: hypothetical protein ENJ46_03810 [Hellea balneolensis]|uniref:DUF4034 domain-containing protein n=1 Tax=Hellea balneolensis TaxID=287478 RepID=A0A7C3C5M8_9PROT|nr:hypothetical protein [Hellea balneolensis]